MASLRLAAIAAALFCILVPAASMFAGTGFIGANGDGLGSLRIYTANAQSDPSNPLMPDPQPAAAPASADEKNWLSESVQIISNLILAVILSGILAFRPRRNVPLFRRSLFVSQTQILLSVVAAALMMIVGDNAARAFAIFAAVSLVRFRTNIRDPKEITVLLISLALGLAAGVGRWDLGIALCLFALALLWLLEFNESDHVVRAMELTVETHDTEQTQKLLLKLFEKKKIDAEIRKIEPPDSDEGVGLIVYYMNLRLSLSVDHLSDLILKLDAKNIEKIQWSKTKNAADIYQ